MRDARAIIAKALCWGEDARCLNEGCAEAGVCGDVETALDTWGADADAILAALDAAGLAVVPVEPTEAMRRAGFVTTNRVQGCSAPDEECSHCGDGFAKPDACGTAAVAAYKAMLAAAKEPKP